MKKHIALMATALLAVATVLSVILYFAGLEPEPDPSTPDYASMDKTELSALVVMNPSWAQPRERLARLLLQEHQAHAALEHMLVLAWDDWDMAKLEEEFQQILDQSGQADSCLNLLAEQRRSWLWPRELAVKISLSIGESEHLLSNIPILLQHDSRHPLVVAALEEYSPTAPLIAWKIASQLGENDAGQLAYTMVQEESHENINAIINNYPDQPLARVLAAHQSGGSDGLEQLLALEAAGFTPWNEAQYTSIKIDLLLQSVPITISPEYLKHLDFAQVISRVNTSNYTLTEEEQSFALDLLLTMEAEQAPPAPRVYSFVKQQLLQRVVPRESHQRQVTEAYFDHVLPQQLFGVLENWMEKLYWSGYDEHGQMEAVQMGGGILAQQPGWEHIEVLLSPPEYPPHQGILHQEDRLDQGQIVQLSLAPDGEQIIYLTANTLWWYNLGEEEYYLAQSLPHVEEYVIHWTPNSTTVALEYRVPEFGNRVQLYSTQETEILWEEDIKMATVLGWQDNNTLLTTVNSREGYDVSSIDITGSSETVTTLPQQPVLTPTGKLAWTLVEDKLLRVSVQGKEDEFLLPRTNLDILGWLQGDRGIIMKSRGGAQYLLDFATGKITELKINGKFTPYPSGWTLENKVPGIFTFGLVNHVMILDIEDMSLQSTGILSHYGAFSGRDYYWNILSGNIYVHSY